jgi:NDP-sugar pyrophosphorylase family protein
MSKRAVILAGGKGTRLRPYTVVLPKPLVPIGDMPILEVIVRQLVRDGFSRITLAVNHQAELIKAFFGDGAKWGVGIDYSLEDQPLSTMGPLPLIADLPENFLVMNGDILTDLDFGAFYDRHVKAGNLFSISSHQREQKVDYGVLEADSSGHLSGFREKPSYTHQVSMGVYMLSRRVVEFVPQGRHYGFDDLMHDLIAARQTVSVVPFDGLWLDIGRPEDYMEAVEVFEKQQTKFLRGC